MENDRPLNCRNVAVLTIVFLLALVLFFSAVGAARSQSETDQVNVIALRVTPSVIINYSKVQGEEFNVNITAFGVESLHGFRARIDYDSSLVDCTSVQEGGLLRAFGNTTAFYEINNALGDVYASVNLTSPEATANGDGSLIKLAFEAKGTGETRLVFHDVSLYDSAGSSLSYATVDGYFNNKLNLDFTMPSVLFVITIVSMFLAGKVEPKLKSVVEKEFRVQDAVWFVGLMSVMIYLIVFVRQVTLILMALFLFAYSMLLFTFAYLFSNNRWYIGILPPAVFILLYVFVRETSFWTFYLVNIYGLLFAVLITLYLVGLFTWKATAVFGVLITAMDIVLVLVTGTMIEAAEAARSLSLPVMVSLPLIPLIVTGNGLLMLSLGLGDFFFAGLLGTQTSKRYGKRFAILTVIGMTLSFFIFEVLLVNYLRRAFPGTLMIICGWAPLVIWKELSQRKRPVVKATATSQENEVKD